ncbi:MAG TPA: hypothetical protein DIW51_03795 [Rhodospirillaceae bacterium]|nr:hypothetical protein [Magnetovibrio sp.]HCS69072.1 hypothetical protein [Rhodospirillaceae bacterium]|tara:strand:+ start:671 stop:1345 length:675 start_codon:yes stop_codon:yes gene_type:complete
MTKTYLPLLAGAVVLGLASGPAYADSWYVAGNVGLTSLSDSATTDTFAGGNVSTDIEYDSGIGLSGAIGRSFGAFRVEGEVSYRNNSSDQATDITGSLAGNLFTAAGPLAIDADMSSLGFLANAYYDFKNDSQWTPFLMGGLGIARLNFDVKSVGGASVNYDETDTVVAYQVGMGVGYQVTPETSVTASYRYFATSDASFNDSVDKVDAEYGTHNFWIGVVHQF